MPYEVILLDEVVSWYLELAKGARGHVDAVTAAIDMLATNGPTLGRPIVDRIKGSSRHNMKELRPSGTNIPIADARYRAWLAREHDRGID